MDTVNSAVAGKVEHLSAVVTNLLKQIQDMQLEITELKAAQVMEQGSQWVSTTKAAGVLGVSNITLTNAVRSGRLTQYDHVGNPHGSWRTKGSRDAKRRTFEFNLSNLRMEF